MHKIQLYHFRHFADLPFQIQGSMKHIFYPIKLKIDVLVCTDLKQPKAVPTLEELIKTTWSNDCSRSFQKLNQRQGQGNVFSLGFRGLSYVMCEIVHQDCIQGSILFTKHSVGYLETQGKVRSMSVMNWGHLGYVLKGVPLGSRLTRGGFFLLLHLQYRVFRIGFGL